jgi:ubiquinone/menaquinone biosynthesis C-methylase UbiE
MTTLEQTRDERNDIAPGYDELGTPTDMWLGNEALERVGLRRGMRFLDVAGGNGALIIPAARLGAHVSATDLSPATIERIRKRVRAEGLGSPESGVMGGNALEFDDDTFDIAASQYGAMCLQDRPRALKEMTRVTRPGGRVALIVHGSPRQVESLGFFVAAIHAVIPGLAWSPDDPVPMAFQAAERHVLLSALAGAGLKDITVETVIQEMRFESGRHLWHRVIHSHPAVMELVSGLPEEQEALVQEVLGGMLRERAAGDGFAILTDASHIGIGTKERSFAQRGLGGTTLKPQHSLASAAPPRRVDGSFE